MTIETVKFNTLTLNKNNPRKVLDKAALAGLAASVKTDGLLQNLVVRPLKGGKKFEIISGERRFRAMQILVKDGDLKPDFPVPVEIKKGLSDKDGLRIATVENIQREQLNPMDEAEAFANMATEGSPLAEIAAKAGVSEGTVTRRLAIASICKQAKAMVRDGTLSLAAAEALTLGTHKQQRDVVKLVREDEIRSTRHIRDILLDDKPSVADAIFPMEKYKGTVTSDLFGEDKTSFFDDIEQFVKLQTEAVEDLVKQHKEAADWVDVVTDHHCALWEYDRADENTVMDDEDAMGVIIHFAPTGKVEIHTGLIIRKEQPKANTEPKEKPEYSRPLVQNINAHKSLALQVALLGNPRKAKEMAVLQMMDGFDGMGSLLKPKIHAGLWGFRKSEAKPATFQAIDAVAQGFENILKDAIDLTPRWGTVPENAFERLLENNKDPLKMYEIIKGLSDADLDQLHTLLTVLAFGKSDMEELECKNSVFAQLAQDLAIDMKDTWRPDRDFLSRRDKTQLIKIARESGAAKKLGILHEYKKGDLVTALVNYFEQTPKNTWLPDAMRFSEVETKPEIPEKAKSKPKKRGGEKTPEANALAA